MACSGITLTLLLSYIRSDVSVSTIHLCITLTLLLSYIRNDVSVSTIHLCIDKGSVSSENLMMHRNFTVFTFRNSAIILSLIVILPFLATPNQLSDIESFRNMDSIEWRGFMNHKNVKLLGQVEKI
jgi:hypothetical protein